MLSTQGIGVLILAFIVLVILSRLIIRRVGRHMAPRWLGCCYLVIAVIPAIELIEMLFVSENGVDAPFFIFWLSFFVYCMVMCVLEFRRSISGRDDGIACSR